MSEKKSKLAELFVQWNPNADEINEKIFKDIKYSKEQMALDLAHLKEWLKEQHHLPECRLRETDNFLTNYLTGCKGSIETVKQKLDAYYTLRGKSEVYSNRDPLDEGYRKACEICYQHIIIKYTKDGEVLFISKLADTEIPPNGFQNALKRVIQVTEIGIRLTGIAKPVISIVDYGNYTPSHAAIFTPGLIRDTLHIVQNVFPTRIRKMILFNVPPFFEIVINTIFKPFLSKKLKDRLIVISGGSEELHKYVDKAALPKDWQGDYPLTIQEINETWNEYEIKYHDWFINELSQLTDETKRIDTGSKLIHEDSYFGVQGTLKKLAID